MSYSAQNDLLRSILFNMDNPVLSIIEVNRILQMIFQENFPDPIQVEGEISSFRPHYSGHAYFTLKDEFAQLGAVMWRSNLQRSSVELDNGKQVICTGMLSIYEKTGRYQLIVSRIKEAGIGDLHKQFEELKKKLFNEGLFDEEHKVSIPVYPQTIGIITSPTGAVIQDIVSVAKRRNPTIQLILRATQVQGESAAADIAEAIGEFNKSEIPVDTIILGRGGGSIEDLWPFNEEVVARAIYDSKIPIVSAVGHETDFTISDFVADKRAPTPSAAAEILIPERREMLGQLLYYQDKIYEQFQFALKRKQQNLDLLKESYGFKRIEDILNEKSMQLEHLKKTLQDRIQLLILTKQQSLKNMENRLNILSHEQTLNRGFVILQQHGQIISKKSKIQDGTIKLLFQDGSISGEFRKDPF